MTRKPPRMTGIAGVIASASSDQGRGEPSIERAPAGQLVRAVALVRLKVGPERVRCGRRTICIEAAPLFDQLTPPALETPIVTLLEAHPGWADPLSLVRPVVLSGPTAQERFTVVAGFETYTATLALARKLSREIPLLALVVPPPLAPEPDGLAALLVALSAREWIPVCRGALAKLLQPLLRHAPNVVGAVPKRMVATLLGVTPQAIWAAGPGRRCGPRRSTQDTISGRRRDGTRSQP